MKQLDKTNMRLTYMLPHKGITHNLYVWYVNKINKQEYPDSYNSIIIALLNKSLWKHI